MRTYLLKNKKYDDGIVLCGVPYGERIPKAPSSFKYFEGVPLLKNFPKQEIMTVYYDKGFNDIYADRTELYDFLPNGDNAFIVNTKVKDVLEKLQIEDLEFLPITVCDFDEKPVSSDYYILNPVGGLDIIDMEKSVYETDDDFIDQIDDIEKLVINNDAISEKSKLFRANKKMDLIFINEEVKEALENADLKGFIAYGEDDWEMLFY